MTKSNNNYYAKSGGGRFDVESDGVYQKDFYYEIEYGHATITLNISFSVSIPGGLSSSIAFSIGVTKMCNASGSYYW